MHYEAQDIIGLLFGNLILTKNIKLKATTLEEFDLVEPPKLRDGFYGGECEKIKLIHDFKNRLYSMLDMLDKNVCYCDTDSMDG